MHVPGSRFQNGIPAHALGGRGLGTLVTVASVSLLAMTWFALKERYYSAVMAATGLLYLAILTAFGTDLVARAVLKP